MVKARHLAYFAAIARIAGERRNDVESDWLAKFETELENIRTALEFADSEEALGILASCADCWIDTGLVGEIHKRLTLAVASTARMSPVSGRAQALFAIAIISFFRGRTGEARAEFADAETEAGLEGDDIVARRASWCIGNCYLQAGDWDAAERSYTQWMTTYQSVIDPLRIASFECNLAIVAFGRNELTEALSRMAVAIEVADKSGNRNSIFCCQINAVLFNVKAGNAGAAAEHLQKVINIASSSDRWWFGYLFERSGDIAWLLKDYESAVRMHGAAVAWRKTVDAKPQVFENAVSVATLKKCKKRIPARYDEVWQEGVEMLVEDAVEAAKNLVETALRVSAIPWRPS